MTGEAWTMHQFTVIFFKFCLCLHTAGLQQIQPATAQNLALNERTYSRVSDRPVILTLNVDMGDF